MSLIARPAAMALAFLGVALLVAQPICSAAETFAAGSQPAALGDAAKSTGEDHKDPAEPCCVSLDAAPVVDAASTSPGHDRQPGLPAHAAPAARWHAAEPPYASPIVASAPRSLRYHARSARILR